MQAAPDAPNCGCARVASPPKPDHLLATPARPRGSRANKIRWSARPKPPGRLDVRTIASPEWRDPSDGRAAAAAPVRACPFLAQEPPRRCRLRPAGRPNKQAVDASALLRAGKT